MPLHSSLEDNKLEYSPGNSEKPSPLKNRLKSIRKRIRLKLRVLTALQNTKMGQTLSEPITNKETTSDECHSLRIGASCMQGWRVNMEDDQCHKLCLNDEKDTHFLAVFDGHGGQAASRYCCKHLPEMILNTQAYRHNELHKAIREGFLKMDEELLNDPGTKEDMSGTTCVSTLIKIKQGKVYCGNVGDSRAVASVRGHVQQLSFDHKPNHERESRRINNAGGWVEFNRVNGNLALSRAFGDFIFKKSENKGPKEQIVTAFPDVIEKEITPEHEFIVLACDGIWDVLSNEEVVDFVRAKLAKREQPEIICEELMDRCLATECSVGGVGCDNMSVTIAVFKHGGSFEQACEKCSMPKRDFIPQQCLIQSYPDFVMGGSSL